MSGPYFCRAAWVARQTNEPKERQPPEKPSNWSGLEIGKILLLPALAVGAPLLGREG